MTKILLQLLFSICLFVMSSCSGNSSHFGHESATLDDYENGTFCADVGYYNPNTGTSSSYILEVEVSDNQLISIKWGNGGWLDNDHFSSEYFDDDGYCEFTSDKGYEFTVQIISPDCEHTDENQFSNDVEDDEESITCPECGGQKNDYDNYCFYCTHELENTCSNCGQIEYYIYGGLCEDCERKETEDDY